MCFSRAVSVASDVATGATAGWLARRRGAAHGATADAIGGAAALAGSVAIGYARMGEAGFMATTGYWLTTLSWMLFGVGVAAIAGAIAVGLRQRRG